MSRLSSVGGTRNYKARTLTSTQGAPTPVEGSKREIHVKGLTSCTSLKDKTHGQQFRRCPKEACAQRCKHPDRQWRLGVGECLPPWSASLSSYFVRLLYMKWDKFLLFLPKFQQGRIISVDILFYFLIPLTTYESPTGTFTKNRSMQRSRSKITCNHTRNIYYSHFASYSSNNISVLFSLWCQDHRVDTI